MANNLTIAAELRTDLGKGASRRLRHTGEVPAIAYGAGKDPQSLTLQHKDVIKALENEAFFSQIIDLNVAGKPQSVVLKDLQRHPYKPKILHMDFMRIKASEKISMLIPLHFIGEDVAPGVKLGSGTFSHIISEVEIKCLPADLPQHIELDVSSMELGDLLHLADLKLPSGVEIPVLAQGEEYNQPVVTLNAPRTEAEVEEVVEEEVTEEATEESKE